MPPFESNAPGNEWDWLSIGLPDAAKAKLRAVLLMRGLTEEDIRAATASDPSVLGDPLAAARRLGSRLVVFGSYRIEGDAIEVSARCVDPGSGRDLATFTGTGPTYDPASALNDVLFEIATNLRLSLSSEETDGIRKPLTAVRDAFKAHAEGLAEMARAGSEGRSSGDAYAVAMPRFEEAIALDPRYADPRYRIALLHEQMGQKEKAEAAYRAAILADFKHRDARLALGLLLKSQGRTADALSELEQALKQFPENPAAQTALSSLWFDQYSGNFAAMEAQYKKAIEANPDDAAAYYELGVVYEELSRPGDSEAQFRAAVRKAPEHGDAHYKLGLIARRAGRNEEAIRELKLAAANGAKSARVHYELAAILSELKRHAEALPEYEKAVKAEPHHTPSHFGLAETLLALDRLPGALSAFQRYSDLSQDDPRPLVRIGRIYAKMQLEAQAEAAYLRALRVNPDDPDARIALGDLFEAQKRLARAAAEYAIALRARPDHPQAAELKRKVENYRPAPSGNAK